MGRRERTHLARNLHLVVLLVILPGVHRIGRLGRQGVVRDALQVVAPLAASRNPENLFQRKHHLDGGTQLRSERRTPEVELSGRTISRFSPRVVRNSSVCATSVASKPSPDTGGRVEALQNHSEPPAISMTTAAAAYRRNCRQREVLKVGASNRNLFRAAKRAHSRAAAETGISRSAKRIRKYIRFSSVCSSHSANLSASFRVNLPDRYTSISLSVSFCILFAITPFTGSFCYYRHRSFEYRPLGISFFPRVCIFRPIGEHGEKAEKRGGRCFIEVFSTHKKKCAVEW